jgi:hypothetical protein
MEWTRRVMYEQMMNTGLGLRVEVCCGLGISCNVRGASGGVNEGRRNDWTTARNNEAV